ncbi:hypothetical protein [Flavobacterium cheniae]|uniref:Uncharacterized protein n=1 Tax=Flavobacterium cheniae TaxID=295428 RepID=A0A562KS48_9FLAO|nr:hypothetical protein [Flavobacterium cheniae]TDR25740.1 hypothetical protein C8D80_0524 [Flavobacterium cheniae]TWH98075.1 hypothetical protein IP97_00015 [Flavobacterium cheniae]
MKLKTKIIIGICLTLFLFFLYICYGLYLMSIEDKYGVFQELYYEIDKSDNYFIIVDNKEAGLIQKLDDEIFVTIDDCMKHLLDYSNKKIEVYQFEISETKTDFTIKDAILLKNNEKTELIFKN